MVAPSPRVLHVVLQLDAGGTERLIIETVRRLRGRFPSAVCCLDEPGLWAGEVEQLGVEVVALRRAPGFQPGLARVLARSAARFGADVLHCHQYSPFVYGRLASLVLPAARVIYTEHGRHSDAPPSRKRRLVNRFLAAGVEHLYAVSHDLRRHMLAEGLPGRVGVIWNGIDVGPVPAPERRAAGRAALDAGDRDIVIGSVGRLDPVKDYVTLVDAFASARAGDPRLRLCIVGDGPERPRLEAAIASAGLGSSAVLAGHRDDARTLMAGFDLYVNSSISEGVSLTLLEAMAARLPIVATAVGGTPEVVVGDETGLLVAPRSAEALARAITALTSDTTRARAFADAGHRRVLQHFTLDRMVESYARLYEGRPLDDAAGDQRAATAS